MPFYSADQTDRSRVVLDRIIATVPAAVLIGGWGTWVRLHGEMSPGMEMVMIVEHHELAMLRARTNDLSKSTPVGGVKYRGDFDGIHVDLYLPHQSRLGEKLRLRVEDLTDHREVVDGYTVLSVQAQIATKIAALLDRPDSQPGEKDRHELVELVRAYDPDPHEVRASIENASSHTVAELNGLMGAAAQYLDEYEPDRTHATRSRNDRRSVELFGRALAHPSDIDASPSGVPGEPAVRTGREFVRSYTKKDGTRVGGYPNPKRGR